MSVPPFRHFAPTSRVIYGEDCLEQLAPEIRRAGGRRAVVFCGRTLARSTPGLATVRAALGELCAGVFEGVAEQSPLPAVEAGVAALRQHAADSVVVLGGGSAVVTARAATIMLGEGKTALELATVFEAGKPPRSPKVAQPKLPQFVIPTTPTTAYAKSGAAVSIPASGRRLSLFDPKARAQTLFLHPGLFASAPARLTRDASLDAFAQGIQGLESMRREPLADALLLHGVRLIWRSLRGVEQQHASADGVLQLMCAAQLIGEGTDYTGAGLASALGHCIGARFAVANGLAKAVVLPHTVRFNASATLGRMEAVAEALGVGDPGSGTAVAESLSQAIVGFCASLGLPSRLRDLGVGRTDLPQIVEETSADWFFTQNPRPVRDGELLQLLQKAW